MGLKEYKLRDNCLMRDASVCTRRILSQGKEKGPLVISCLGNRIRSAYPV